MGRFQSLVALILGFEPSTSYIVSSARRYVGSEQQQQNNGRLLTGIPVQACVLGRGGRRLGHIGTRRAVASSATEEGLGLTVYFTPGCPYCVAAKRALDELGLAWEGIDVSEAELREAMTQKTGGVTSVPQIFAGEKGLGGHDDLIELRDSGELEAMVEALGLRRAAEKTTSATEATTGAVGADVRDLIVPGGPLNVLKEAGALGDVPSSPLAAAAQLQRQALALFDNFVSLDGASVDYKRMVTSLQMGDFVQAAAALGACFDGETEYDVVADLGALTQDFWINLYNALVMHGSCVVGHPKSKEERGAFFSGTSGVTYQLGPVSLSLDDIEHGILRGSPSGDPRSFEDSDPRRSLAIEKMDPRVHFALNCGAKSCPPVRVFSPPPALDKELKAAATAFVMSSISVSDETGEVRLSKIFEWYKSDFGPTDEKFLRALISYLPWSSPLRASLTAVKGRLSHGYGRAIFVYEEYEWERNDLAA